MIFELYIAAGISDIMPVFGKLVADSEVLGFTSRVTSKLAVAEMIDAATASNYTLASVATSGGTTTLTKDSATVQQFTGSSTQTVVLPTTDVPSGLPFYFVNASTGALIINASGGGFLTALASGGSALVISLGANPTSPGSWLALPFDLTTSLAQTLPNKTFTDGKWTQTINAQTAPPTP